MPKALMIAGPHGAGKTMFANEYLSGGGRVEFISADEIAHELANLNLAPHYVDMRAARIMLQRVDELVNIGTDFILETTLASLVYAPKISVWRRRGYVVSLVYLRLASVEESIARVKKRVDNGGHNIPEETIRRRFPKSVKYLNELYKSIVDEWYIWDSLEGAFVQAERWDRQ